MDGGRSNPYHRPGPHPSTSTLVGSTPAPSQFWGAEKLVLLIFVDDDDDGYQISSSFASFAVTNCPTIHAYACPGNVMEKIAFHLAISNAAFFPAIEAIGGTRIRMHVVAALHGHVLVGGAGGMPRQTTMRMKMTRRRNRAGRTQWQGRLLMSKVLGWDNVVFAAAATGGGHGGGHDQPSFLLALPRY